MRREVKRDADVSLVAEAIKLWRLQNEPADDDGPPMADFIVAVLESQRRLR